MGETIDNNEARENLLWKSILLQNFAESIGVSLDELNTEYEDMIKNFELQKSYLKKCPPNEKTILENETIRAPSPTPSGSSQNSDKNSKRIRTFSAVGIQSSFRNARNTLRRKISGRNPSPLNEANLSRKQDHDSVSSLSKPDSEPSSFEQESVRRS